SDVTGTGRSSTRRASLRRETRASEPDCLDAALTRVKDGHALLRSERVPLACPRVPRGPQDGRLPGRPSTVKRWVGSLLSLVLALTAAEVLARVALSSHKVTQRLSG